MIGGASDRPTNEPRSSGPSRPDGGKPPPPGPGDIYEIEDGTDAVIITGAPGPGRAKNPKSSRMRDADSEKGG